MKKGMIKILKKYFLDDAKLESMKNASGVLENSKMNRTYCT